MDFRGKREKLEIRKKIILMFTDEYYMKLALQEAEQALEKDEVPVGCIIVSKNRIIARAHNLTETLNDVTAVSYTHLTLPTMKCRCRSRWSPYH